MHISIYVVKDSQFRGRCYVGFGGYDISSTYVGKLKDIYDISSKYSLGGIELAMKHTRTEASESRVFRNLRSYTMWRPKYLQLWVLITHAAIFILLVALLEGLLAISNHENGLATPSSPHYEYVWKYGPTAFLTIISLSWDRVAFQSQILAPWYRMLKGKANADQSLLLDYLDMLPPTAILTAIRRHDWAPAAALSVSLLLQVVVALSTGLLDLRATQMNSTVPVELGTSFDYGANVTDDYTGPAHFAHIIMAGISDFGLRYPEGTNDRYAYQTLSTPPTYGTSVQVDVDGFGATLDCRSATLKRHQFSLGSRDNVFDAQFELGDGNCSAELSFEFAPKAPQNFTSLSFVRLSNGPCVTPNGQDDGYNVTAIIFGRVRHSLEPQEGTATSNAIRLSSLNLTSSTQVICAPSGSMNRITLTQNGTSAKVENATTGRSAGTLDPAIIYRFMQAHFDTLDQIEGEQAAEIDTRDNSTLAMDIFADTVRLSELSDLPGSALDDPSVWLVAIPRYFERFYAQIARLSILRRAPTTVTAVQLQTGNRLFVSGPVCHAMAVILGACALSGIVVRFSVPKCTSLETNPTSILGTVGIAREASSLILSLRDQACAKPHTIKSQLDTATYTLIRPAPDIFRLVAHRSPQIRPSHASKPAKGKYAMALHPISRSLFVLSLGGSIAALEILFRLSKTNDGIGRGDLSYYLQYSWSIIPSILLTLMSLLAGSIDTATRALAPLLNSSRGGRSGVTVDLDLLDGSIPRIFYRGVNSKCWTVLFSIAAFSISSTLSTFSSSLYSTQTVPISFSPRLIVETILDRYGIDNDIDQSPSNKSLSDFEGGKPVIASTVILARNGSFPPFAYQDLALYSVSLDGLPATSNQQRYGLSNDTAISVVANLPAVRSRLECRVYTENQIQTNLTLGYTAAGHDPVGSSADFRIPNPLRMDIQGEQCLISPSDEYRASTIIIPTLKENVTHGEVTFGVSSGLAFGDFHDERGWVGGCGMILYAWGRVLVGPDGRSAIETFALGCNETIETVDAEVHFNTTTLTVDSEHPPVVDERSRQPSNIPFNAPHDSCYYGMDVPRDPSPEHVFDEFFTLLTTSPWAIPIHDLFNASAVDKVVRAIQAQHGIVRAMAIDFGYRTRPNETASSSDNNNNSTRTSTESIISAQLPEASPLTFYAANATIHPGPLRVVQDEQLTRVLQGLLASTLALSLLAWWLSPRTDVIVGSPTSVARRIALAAAGNLFDEVCTPGTATDRDTDHRVFVLGWRRRRMSEVEKTRFGIWALGSGDVDVDVDVGRC
ncbi:hypothetical protein F5Y17DRAFT_170707 [Xylariaceae sp. FL0594]|nr:hypothetical protein F5Y17DRAFT_170707 [Xylariaceae sp. FL0594]